MATFVLKGLGQVLLVRSNGGEGGAREIAAGKGKNRDERFMSQDHVSCDEVGTEGSEGVLFLHGEREPVPAEAEEPIARGRGKGRRGQEGDEVAAQEGEK